MNNLPQPRHDGDANAGQWPESESTGIGRPRVQDSDTANVPSVADAGSTDKAPVRKRRRFRRVLAVLFLLFLGLVGLIAAAPSLASSARVRGVLLSQANQLLKGHVDVSGLQLSWTGSQELTELSVKDAQERVVLQVSRVHCARGLWSLLTSGLDLGDLRIESPRAVLHVDAESNVSLADALQSPTASPPAVSGSSGTFPRVSGKLNVSDGAIRAIRHDGRTMELTELNLQADIQAMASATLDLAMRLANGPTLSARLDLRDLTSGGSIDIMQVNGTARVQSSQPIPLASLGEFFDPSLKLVGTAQLDVSASGDAAKMSIDGLLEVAALRTAAMPADAAPLNARLMTKSVRERNVLTSQTALSGDIGKASIDFTYRDSEASPTLDDILGAMADGRKTAWPDLVLTGTAGIDIARLGRAFPGLLRIRPGQTITGGSLDVSKLNVNGGAEPRIAADVALRGLTAGIDGRVVQVEPITLTADAGVAEGQGLVVRSARFTSGFAQLTASGAASAVKAEYSANLARLQSELGKIFEMGSARWTGEISGSATVESTASDRTLISDGSLRVKGFGVDNRPIGEGDSTAEWTRVRFGASTIAADAVRLSASIGSVEARGIQCNTASGMQVSADVTVAADVAKCLKAQANWQRSAHVPDLSGRAGFAARVSTSGGRVVIAGRGGVDDFSAGSGASAVREKRIDIVLDAAMDTASDSLALTALACKSSLLTVEAAGSVQQVSAAKNLSVRGTYRAAWDQLTNVLKALSPVTADLVAVRGESAGPIEVAGPANAPNTRPPFKSLRGGLPIAWASADLFGLPLAAATLQPALRDGRLTLPAVTISAADGKVNLGGSLDFTAADPMLTLAGRVALLDNVPITRQVSDNLLSRINPLFLQTTRAEGRVSLVVQDVAAPLGDSVKRSGSGSGYMDLGKVRLAPGGIFGDLADLAGIDTKELIPVEFSRATFELKQGRLFYENFKLTFPQQFDLVFRGSVGFDDTLDLIVSMPVSEALLRRAGVKGPALAYVKQLQGLRVDVPLVGTRKEPRLDFSKVNVDKFIKDALLPKNPQQGIDAILKGLSGEKEESKPAPAKPAPAKPAPGKPRGGLRPKSP